MTEEIKFDRESKKILRDLIRAIDKVAKARNAGVVTLDADQIAAIINSRTTEI